MDSAPEEFEPPGPPASAFGARLRLALLASVGAVSLFGMRDALIRPVALWFGKPATAVVGAKGLSYGRHGSVGHRLRLDYLYAPESPASAQLSVNESAYSEIAANAVVPIHFVPGCPSCVALDKDYASAAQQVFCGLLALVLFALLTRLFFLMRPAGRTGPAPDASAQ